MERIEDESQERKPEKDLRQANERQGRYTNQQATANEPKAANKKESRM